MNKFEATHKYVTADSNVVAFKVGDELQRLRDSRYEGVSYFVNAAGKHQYVSDDCVEAI